MIDENISQTKKCNKCNNEKSIEEFYRRYNKRRSKIEVSGRCKLCENEFQSNSKRKKEWYEENKPEYLEKFKKYRQEHAEELKQYWKQYRKDNAEIIQAKSKERYEKNKREINKKHLEKVKSDPIFKLTLNLRRRLSKVMCGHNKADKTISLLGCTPKEFMNYLESKFRDGMTFENYGSYWHIDHIKPCCKFDLSIEEEQRRCFHYTNLQPLLVKENLSKGGRYNEEIKNEKVT